MVWEGVDDSSSSSSSSSLGLFRWGVVVAVVQIAGLLSISRASTSGRSISGQRAIAWEKWDGREVWAAWKETLRREGQM